MEREERGWRARIIVCVGDITVLQSVAMIDICVKFGACDP